MLKDGLACRNVPDMTTKDEGSVLFSVVFVKVYPKVGEH